MAKARSRATARKIKDKWKAKNWYDIQAPPAFDNITVSNTLSDTPKNLINRVTEVSLQDITNDFRKSHIKLFFKINKVEDTIAHTQYEGHTLTSDYLRRMIRRRRSKVDGVYDVKTRDGATVRIKPFATTDRRIQNSQKKSIRNAMKQTITEQAQTSTLSEFVKKIIDGKTGGDIYKNCKKLYPVKRVEIYKTEVISQPTIMIKEKKPAKPKEEKTEEIKEEKEKKTTTPKKTSEKKPEKNEEDKKTEEVKEEKPKKPAKETKQKKPASKKTAAKKAPVKKAATKKTTAKKPAAKKKTTKKKEE